MTVYLEIKKSPEIVKYLYSYAVNWRQYETIKQLCVQSTSTPHPKGKGKRGYLVIDCTYCAHHPSNPHRSHLGLSAVPGHVRRSPAPRTAPSRSARTPHRLRPGCPQTPRIHSWKRKTELKYKNNKDTTAEKKPYSRNTRHVFSYIELASSQVRLARPVSSAL